MRRPYVIAHRGASGYEYENSRAAFRRAVMLDADGVELDVHATRDGAIVVHHDAEIPGFGPIALLSLGATRRMTIRAKAAPRRVVHVELAAGSLLLMSYETQLHYTHGIPKTSDPVGPRISLAFRVRPVAD